jgi:tRNA-dihydrouridine synthase
MRDKLSPTTKIIGNGDVLSRAQGLELAQKYQLDGIMIGRGVFHDPFVFGKNSPWATYTKQQRLELYAKHVKLFAETWKNDERRVHTLNKFCKIYVQDFNGAKELREELMAAKSTDELLVLIDRNN